MTPISRMNVNYGFVSAITSVNISDVPFSVPLLPVCLGLQRTCCPLAISCVFAPLCPSVNPQWGCLVMRAQMLDEPRACLTRLRELAHRHAHGRRDVHLAGVLHRPAGLLKLIVDFLAGFLFGRHDCDWLGLDSVPVGCTRIIPRPIIWTLPPMEVLRSIVRAGDIPSQPTSIIPKARVRKKPKKG